MNAEPQKNTMATYISLINFTEAGANEISIAHDAALNDIEVRLDAVNGTVSLTIPKGASSGQALRLRGRGVKPAGGKERGDQLVALRIVSPAKVDEALAKFMETWRKANGYNPREGMKL